MDLAAIADCIERLLAAIARTSVELGMLTLEEALPILVISRTYPFWMPGMFADLDLDVFVVVRPWRSAHGTCKAFHVTDQLEVALCKVSTCFLALEIFGKI